MSFAGLVVLGSGGVQVENLTNQDWSKVPSAVPVMYIAMVFHNVVPVVTTQLEGELSSLPPTSLALLGETAISSADRGFTVNSARCSKHTGVACK